MPFFNVLKTNVTKNVKNAKKRAVNKNVKRFLHL